MKKEERIKKLTKKFFIEQKAKEITKFLMWIVFGICLIIPIEYLGKYIESILGAELILANLWYEFLIYSLMGFLFLVLAFFIIFSIIKILEGIVYSFKYWIESNWELAEERAREEIK